MEYDLKWENYRNWTENCISELSTDTTFSDVTLMSDDLQTFKAHKIILSKCSNFFQKVLESMPRNNTDTLFLKGVDGSTLKYMLKFIYEGAVSVPEEGLTKFLEIGFDLKVVGIISGSSKESVMRMKNTEEAKSKDPTENIFTTPTKIIEESSKEVSEALDSTENDGENLRAPTKIMEEKLLEVSVGPSEKDTDDSNQNEISINDEHIDEAEVQIKEEFNVPSDTFMKFQMAALDINEQKIYECTYDPNVCNKKFSLETSLKNHISKKHLGTVERKFECPDCFKKFYTRNEVTLHFDRKHRALEKKHPCSICDKKFYQAGDLKAHVKGVHDRIKDFQCNFCDLAFSQGCNLKTHIRKIHTSKMMK